jgi:hypothetical protein
MFADHASSRVGVVANDLSRPSPTLRRRVATSGTATVQRCALQAQLVGESCLHMRVTVHDIAAQIPIAS